MGEMSITVRKIIRTGDSLAVVLPKAYLKLLELRHGDSVVMSATRLHNCTALELYKLDAELLLSLRADRAAPKA